PVSPAIIRPESTRKITRCDWLTWWARTVRRRRRAVARQSMWRGSSPRAEARTRPDSFLGPGFPARRTPPAPPLLPRGGRGGGGEEGGAGGGGDVGVEGDGGRGGQAEGPPPEAEAAGGHRVDPPEAVRPAPLGHDRVLDDRRPAGRDAQGELVGLGVDRVGH